jgi:carbamoyltransferase
MEFGPRALGARSILADPRREDMRDHINALVKKREGFRPFAPAAPVEQAGGHFNCDHEMPFMLETVQVRDPAALPAVAHVDGSARLQTVDPEVDSRFHRLLTEFGRLTGYPVLLNTSFNERGEPIVCDPEDGLGCFVRCELDALVLGELVVRRDDIPPAWALANLAAPRHAPDANRDMYTFF